MIVTANGAFDDRDVDHVFVIGPAGEFPDMARLGGGHLLDVAAGQQAGQAGLARTASPRLGYYGGWDGRYDLFGDEADMEGPHAPVIAIAGNQSPGVVGDAGHYADRLAVVRPSNSRARANPSASSCSDSGPWSDSHSATARRPASKRSRWEAVSAIHALNEVPEASAAASIALARSGGNDTERLSRCAIRRW